MKSPRFLLRSFRKVLSLIYRRVIGKSNHVQIGTQEIEVTPLRAKQALQVLLVIVPYLKDVIPSLIATKAISEPGLFREAIREIMIEMSSSFPEDVLEMMSVFLGVNQKWLEERFYPEQMIKAFEVIARVNHLDDLMRLGLSVGMISFADLSWMRGISGE